MVSQRHHPDATITAAGCWHQPARQLEAEHGGCPAVPASKVQCSKVQCSGKEDRELDDGMRWTSIHHRTRTRNIVTDRFIELSSHHRDSPAFPDGGGDQDVHQDPLADLGFEDDVRRRQRHLGDLASASNAVNLQMSWMPRRALLVAPTSWFLADALAVFRWDSTFLSFEVCQPCDRERRTGEIARALEIARDPRGSALQRCGEFTFVHGGCRHARRARRPAPAPECSLRLNRQFCSGFLRPAESPRCGDRRSSFP